MKKIAIAVAALPLLSLTACGFGGNPISSAEDSCEELGFTSNALTYEKDSISGTVTTEDSEQIDAVGCLLNELDANTAMVNQMDNTNALMGLQTYEDEDANLEYKWSYHPDNGFFFSVESL
jgi:hypothetical protein